MGNMKSYHNKRLITLTVITLIGFHSNNKKGFVLNR